MVRTSYFIVFTVTTIVLLGVLAGSSGAAAGDTTRVNVDSSGAEANGNTYDTPSISADGRFVVFESEASNLVADDTNNVADVFVRDRDTDDDGVLDEEGYVSTERVSVDSSETQSDKSSFHPSISADGRFVAFESMATNLVKGDTGGWDVFVRDLQEGTTETVTFSNGDQDPNGPPPSISADGRFVSFTSTSPDLVSDDTNNVTDIFVHDRELGTTERVNKSSDGTQANDGTDNTSWWFVVEESSISADGRFVAFRSYASNLAAYDSEDSWDIFVRDRDTDDDGVFDEEGYVSTEMVSLSYPYSEWSANDTSFAPSVSADGRFVSFSSWASDLVTGDTNSVGDVFVRDRDTDDDGVFDEEGTTSRVSVNSDGTQVNDGGTYDSGSEYPSISADGRYVAFQSAGSIRVVGETSGRGGLFVRDRDADADGVFDEEQAAYTQRVSRGGSSSISADGTYVAFLSTASDLVTDDKNTKTDVFVHERAAPPSNDYIEPSTTASATTTGDVTYTSDTWTNQDVKVTLSAEDNEGGSGIKEIRYSATGAQNIAETVYNDSQSPLVINTEGTTQISYYATDNAGNRESAKTLTVKLDKSAPTVSASPTPGSYASAQQVALTASETADIYYTTNGSTPTTSSSKFDTATPINVAQSQTIKALAVDKAGNKSTVASFEYVINIDSTAPTVTAPKHSLIAMTSTSSSQAKLGTSTSSPPNSVPVRLDWSGQDTSGIASYELQQSTNGGAFANSPLSSPTATNQVVNLEPTKSHRFQVRATDINGNVSTFEVGPSCTPRVDQESSSRIVDSGTWTTKTTSSASSGALQYASAAGRLATYSVPADSTNVAWVSTFDASRGRAAVTLIENGVRKPSVTVDTYRASGLARSVVFAQALDPTKTYKVEVKVLGTKTSTSTGTRVDVDAFAYTTN